MLEILKYVLSSFWIFSGFCILFLIVGYTMLDSLLKVYSFSLNLIFKFYNRLLRFIVILFRGWPPEHLDADGDFKIEKEVNKP